MAARILIVEDERDLAEVLKAKLNAAGHRCAVLTDAKKALEFIRQRQPDLVITDLMMPYVSGFELCRKVRMDPIVYATPVLVLSAMGGRPEIEHAYEQGASDYIVKPFDPGELLQRVRDLLEHRKDADAVNPTTGLPGRDRLLQIVMNKLFRDEKIAVLHLSLAHSTGYTNAYGHDRRDAAMSQVAEMIPDAAKACDALEVYTAHLGHFDFLICCNAPDAHKLAKVLLRRFERLKSELYDAEALEHGRILVKGVQQPIMHPMISIITNEHHSFGASRLIHVAMELSRRVPENGTAQIITAEDVLII